MCVVFCGGGVCFIGNSFNHDNWKLKREKKGGGKKNQIRGNIVMFVFIFFLELYFILTIYSEELYFNNNLLKGT